MKIACLLQSHLSGNMIGDSSLQQDAVRIILCAKRIANVLAGLLWLDEDHQNECTRKTVLPVDTTATLSKSLPPVCSAYKCMVNIMELKKTLQLGTWLNRPLVSLATCPLLTAKDIDRLITSRLLTTGQIEKVQPTDLEQILGKPAPIGEQLLNYTRGIPNYSLDVEKLDSSHSENEVIRFCIKGNRMCAVDTVFVLVGDAHNKLIAKHQFQSWELVDNGCQKEIMICKKDEGQRISFTVCSTNFAGVDLHTSFVLPPSEQNEAQACDSSTDAHLPPSLTEISIGYAEKDLAEDLSITYPNALQQPTVRWVSTAPPLSQSVSQTPTFPQSPTKKPKKVPSFKFARKRPSDTNSTSDFTPRSNTTFTWIPAAPNYTPRAPLIQTSMLDYMRSQEASTSLDMNTGTKENTPVGLNPDKPAHSSMVIDITSSSDADKKRRFHWSPVRQSNKSFEEPEQDNHIWCNAHETSALVSNRTRTTWSHCDSSYDSVDRDIDHKSTRTPIHEIVYSAGTDESQTSEHYLRESIFTPEVKPDDEQVTSSQNEVEEVFEAVFEQWERELSSPPNKPASQKCELPISEVPPGQQKDGTPVPDFRSTCLDSKSNTLPPLHPEGSEQTFRPETNTSTVHSTTQTTPIRARYIREGSDGTRFLYTPLVLTQTNRYQETRPRFSITPIDDVSTGGMMAPVPRNTTTKLSSTIDQKEQKCEKSLLEFKVPGNVRFEKLTCKSGAIDQPPEGEITSSSELSGAIDFELINSGWAELACWIRVNEICQYHELDGRLSDQTEDQSTHICDTPLWKSHQESMEINRNVTTKVCLGQTDLTDNIPSKRTKMTVDLDEYHNNSASIEE
ncbi:hypothetical protein AHF37_03593 [Paragonimus kellicotti]|nr:hypothetical protein AHF37_03593 [Paragonimus kellicotti]